MITALRIAAIYGFLAVALGAFGAHKLKPILEAKQQLANWQTGTIYHLVHAVVLLVLAHALSSAGRTQPDLTFWLFAIGITIFSGSLYVMGVTGITKLGMITPIGGLCLLAGWVLLAVRGFGQ